MISADRGIECQSCGMVHPPGRKRCDCGAWFGKPDAKADKPPMYETCDYCQQERRWYRFKSENHHNDPHRLVGRSIGGGYVCLPCYQKRPDLEFNFIDAKALRLSEGDNEIGAMIRASRGPMSNEDRSEILQWARTTLANMGKRA